MREHQEDKEPRNLKEREKSSVRKDKSEKTKHKHGKEKKKDKHKAKKHKKDKKAGIPSQLSERIFFMFCDHWP